MFSGYARGVPRGHVIASVVGVLLVILGGASCFGEGSSTPAWAGALAIALGAANPSPTDKPPSSSPTRMVATPKALLRTKAQPAKSMPSLRSPVARSS